MSLYNVVHPLACDIFLNPCGWWAYSVATFCPSRPPQLAHKNITKHGEQVDEQQRIMLNCTPLQGRIRLKIEFCSSKIIAYKNYRVTFLVLKSLSEPTALLWLVFSSSSAASRGLHDFVVCLPASLPPYPIPRQFS